MKKIGRNECEEVVRGHGWLSQMPPAFQKAWLSKCDLVQVSATQQLYQVGDGPGALYGVAYGRLEIYLQKRGYASSLAYFAGPGFWLGEMGAAGGRRVVTVVARSKSYLFRMPHAQIQFLGLDAALVWKSLSMILLRNIATTLNVVDSLKREEPTTRVATMLVNLLNDLPDGETCIRASQSDLASLTSLSRGSVNAALAHLEARNMLARSYGAVDITNAVRLRKFAGRV